MDSEKWVACYARVSTFHSQKNGLESQIAALKQYCKNHGLEHVRWYKDKMSGKDTNRPAFTKLQKRIFEGQVHTVIVWKLDRLSRTLRDGLHVMADWLSKGVRIVSVTQQLDFSGVTGQLVASVLFAVAEMERENIRENTVRGLERARRRGKKLGRKRRLTATKIQRHLDQGLNLSQAAKLLKVTRSGCLAALRREGVQYTPPQSK